MIGAARARLRTRGFFAPIAAVFVLGIEREEAVRHIRAAVRRLG